MTPPGSTHEVVPCGSFTYPSEVFFDELDPMQMLHNARYATHVERATTRLYHSLGFDYERNVADNPDQHHAVRRFEIDFLLPVVGEVRMDVSLWVARMGASSCTYAFACTSAGALHASGTRTIVKLDPSTWRPAPWTELFRARHTEMLVRDGRPHQP